MNDTFTSNEIHGGTSTEVLKRSFLDNLSYRQAKFPAVATTYDHYMALAYTVRDRIMQHWLQSASTYYEQSVRSLCYLSAEFLLGPHLGNNLVNLGMESETRQAMLELGLDLDRLLAEEEEPGLGNGGLGRLAACYLDSLASLQIPAIGYGIRYEFGIFDQELKDGWQVERTDKWLRYGNPWEVARPEITFTVGFGGSVREQVDSAGNYQVEWVPDRHVMGMAYDTLIGGYGVPTANLLRLWQAQASESFDFQLFNVGDYQGAVLEKIASENISKVLYPNDEALQGKVLRLQQQYFFTSCALQDMIRIYLQRSSQLGNLHEKFTVQLNDTHPAIGVAELMRLLIDQHAMPWELAWEITRRTFAYTNHTLLPEALERWSVELLGRLLPRHLQIILEINRRHLEGVRKRYPGDEERASRLSLIEEQGSRAVRMAHLACVGSYSINGVAELHSRLLRDEVLRDFHDLTPEKFHNVTNGVTPRRFMLLANPRLSALITHAIGDGWIRDLDQLHRLEPLADDAAFRAEWRVVKRAVKEDLAEKVQQRTGISVDPESLFDVQVKRFHEYKRQHLNLLHILSLYFQIKDNPAADVTPRTFLFAGKAAPGYQMAKLIIKLINSVGEVVNGDSDVNGRLRVAFFPDFNVKNGQWIYPAADLSEQISTAGKEASGTGNMKLSMNGALTIGTLDGANIEIRDHVGPENFFCFGMTVEEVASLQAAGYDPGSLVRDNADLSRIMHRLSDGTFSRGDTELFRPLVENLQYHDPFFVLADFSSYVERQREVSAAFQDREVWTQKSILNVARMGHFSSDRSIRDYCREIWQIDAIQPNGFNSKFKP
ncbi:Maltodextrin phosphorylase [Novipirellula artificiosorum]|uniref:Alpha-1,4 glucan phosphorylase n=2 Tax=Novipirellula artificiosorum TaxID=2528016 RepID=A0A5C6DXE5_9BACT|nr:Maltodextrin phosphorylase [Novipirellula artificiosorum]